MKLFLFATTFLILFLGLILTGLRSGRESAEGYNDFISDENNKPRYLSIKQIDSLTSATNIRFARFQN